MVDQPLLQVEPTGRRLARLLRRVPAGERRACLSSANDAGYIVETVPFSNSFGAFGFHWLGERLLIDHNISSMVCLDGPANANWPAEARSRSPQLGRYGGCISLMPGPGGQSVFDEDPCDWFAVAATPCLCATRLQPVAPSTETLAWLTAKREEILNELTPVAVRTFVIAVLLMLVPLACLLMGLRAPAQSHHLASTPPPTPRTNRQARRQMPPRARCGTRARRRVCECA